ncbi:MFS transporter [Lederbergia lenta]|uniref:MFS transporter n=1 Tax=Lederbergia lenta TaxID=1467 RepID=UPI00398A7465
MGTPIVTVAMARLDQRKQLLTALTVILTGIISTITLPGFGFLMASRVILRVGTGVFVVNAYGIASKGHKVGAMANVAVGYSASLVFGVPLGRVIAAASDWKIIFWGIGVFSLLSVFAIARAIPATEGVAPVQLGKQLALFEKSKDCYCLKRDAFHVYRLFGCLYLYCTIVDQFH